MLIIFLGLLAVLTTSFAQTPIYMDERYVVSVSEKPSRPGARGKGPCGSGLEISLQVSSPKNKKVLLTELIESCKKNIDLEESVDESVVVLGKQIFVLQENGFGALDLSTDTPTYKSGGEIPEEIKSVVMKLENCNHWSGEEPTNEKRKKEIEGNLRKLGCEKLPAQVEALKKKHAADPLAQQYLEAAVKEYQ